MALQTQQCDDETMKLIQALYRPSRSMPMISADGRLDLAARRGFIQAIQARDPRQVCIVHENELAANEINSEQSRANLVLGGGDPEVLRSGSLLNINGTEIRITFRCEPCKHGAQLAGVPMGRFRNLKRYLGLTLKGESVSVNHTVTVYPDVFESWEDNFRDRVARALNLVPDRERVLSTELLFAIGAGKVYARALPRWVEFSELTGARPGIVQYVSELDSKDVLQMYPLAKHLWGELPD